jgi:hypothetical protein
MADEPKTECRTPAEGRDGVTRIPTWKYNLVRDRILEIVRSAGEEGAPFKGLAQRVGDRLSDDDCARLGSVGWHTTVVKLNMEVEGELRRSEGSGAQRIWIN